MSFEEMDRAVGSLLLTDPGGRGVRHLFVAGQIAAAADSLRGAAHVVLATGFFVPGAGACETDGPPGAMALSEGLRRLGIPTTFLTDVWCEPVLRRAGFEPRLIQEAIDSLPAGTTHLVAIERLGRTRGGRYFNMRGVDVTATTGDVDRWFSQDRDGGRRTIGIGDGGNEIGMGNVEERVRQHIPNGPTIASCVTTDWNIAAGTSNWGAWGLLAMLSLMTGRPLLPTREEAAKQLESLVAAGAVDGVTGIRAATVDKLEPEVYFHLLDALWKRHDGSKNGSGADSSPPPCDHGDRR